MIKWGRLFGLVWLLTACQQSAFQQTSPFQLPDKVAFQGQVFTKVTDNQLDTLRQALYLPENSRQTPDNWQTGVLIFTDQREPIISLAQRQAERLAYYANTPNQVAIEIVDNELRSQIIYPPTDKQANVQLEVSRGRNEICGYGQLQFAEKYPVLAKNPLNLTAYQQDLQRLAQQFQRLAWQLSCQL